MATGGGVPPDKPFKALHTNVAIGAVVLIFGFPQLSDTEMEVLKKTGAKVVVVSSLRPGYQRLLDRQAIHPVIVRQLPDQAPATARKAQTVR